MPDVKVYTNISSFDAIFTMKYSHTKMSTLESISVVKEKEIRRTVAVREMVRACDDQLPLSKIHLRVVDFSPTFAYATVAVTSYDSLFKIWFENTFLRYVFDELLEIHNRTFARTHGTLSFSLIMLLLVNSIYGEVPVGLRAFLIDAESTSIVLDHLRSILQEYNRWRIGVPTPTTLPNDTVDSIDLAIPDGTSGENKKEEDEMVQEKCVHAAKTTSATACPTTNTRHQTHPVYNSPCGLYVHKVFQVDVDVDTLVVDYRGLRELFLYGFMRRMLECPGTDVATIRTTSQGHKDDSRVDSSPGKTQTRVSSWRNSVDMIRATDYSQPYEMFESTFHLSFLHHAHMDTGFHLALTFPRYEMTLREGLKLSTDYGVDVHLLAACTSRGRCPSHIRLEWCLQLCIAVNILHRLHITHFDIKLENIMLTREGSRVVLIDYDSAAYGLIRPIQKTLDVRTTLTVRPPEQWIPWDGGIETTFPFGNSPGRAGTGTRLRTADETHTTNKAQTKTTTRTHLSPALRQLLDYRPTDVWSLAVVVSGILFPAFYQNWDARWLLYWRNMCSHANPTGNDGSQCGRRVVTRSGFEYEDHLSSASSSDTTPPQENPERNGWTNFPDWNVYLRIYRSMRATLHQLRSACADEDGHAPRTITPEHGKTKFSLTKRFTFYNHFRKFWQSVRTYVRNLKFNRRIRTEPPPVDPGLGGRSQLGCDRRPRRRSKHFRPHRGSCSADVLTTLDPLAPCNVNIRPPSRKLVDCLDSCLALDPEQRPTISILRETLSYELFGD